MTATLDVDEVRRALDTHRVLDYYGWKARRSADELESSSCADFAGHSRRAFLINSNSGRWRCFPCATAGDLFDFIARVEKLKLPGDFPAVLAKAAEIAGVVATDISAEERARRKAEWQRKRALEEEQARKDKAARDEAAVPKASSYWSELYLKHERGLAYLTERGVIAAMRFDVIRFDWHQHGSPAVPLFTSDGKIRNVVRRRLPELGEPKTPGLKDCPTAGTLINSFKDVETMPSWDVVVTEGVFDSITAAIAWPKGLVLGAHGAGNMPSIAKHAARVVAKNGSRLFIVPHHDRTGFECAVEAGEAAARAGLSIRKGSLHIVRHGAKDLNEAWRGGWRPAA